MLTEFQWENTNHAICQYVTRHVSLVTHQNPVILGWHWITSYAAINNLEKYTLQFLE